MQERISKGSKKETSERSIKKSKIRNQKISKINKVVLKNGIKTYILNDKETEVIKISVIFEVGHNKENKHLLATFANQLHKEAGEGRTANETAEIFDFYGSKILSSISFEKSELELTAPNDFIYDVFPYFANIVINPSFPENEFELTKTKFIEKIKLSAQKTKYIAHSNLYSIIFGNESSRGHITTIQDIENITLNEVKEFASKHYIAKNASIYIYGNISDDLLNFILSYFDNDNLRWNQKRTIIKNIISSPNKKAVRIDKIVKDSQQNSLYLATVLNPLKENEKIELAVINTILGGYFGSRLMSTIREKKGYTYGIYSYVIKYNDCTILVIACDLGNDYIEKTIVEIKKEICKLRTVILGEKELERVKNYLMGDLIASIDGSINQFDMWKLMIEKKIHPSYLERAFKRYGEISSEEIRDIARKYLRASNFFISVAGAKPS